MNRRDMVLSAATVLGAGPAFGSDNGRVTAAPDRVLTHVRMRAHPDGRPCYTWYRGSFYAQRAGERTLALLHVEGTGTSRTQREADGSWSYRLKEAGWFCDLDSHQVLNEWRNPFIDKLVRPGHYNSKQQLHFAADGTVTPATATLPPGLEWQGSLSVPVVVGNDVWSAEELLVRIPGPPGGSPRVQTSLATFHANARDLQKPLNAWVPATLAYQTLGSWLPWMEMGDAKGVISWRLAGRKCATLAELPVPLRERIQREHPEVFE